jgi:glycosyltransferase involved in cell wall biosynthesis
MDRANHALAAYLGGREEVHLVTHRAWPDVATLPGVVVHAVPRPFRRHLLGAPLLARAGRGLWRTLPQTGRRAVVNGGNCLLPAANWVHYLHAAAAPSASSAAASIKSAFTHRRDRTAELAALSAARVVICNSERTRRDAVERAGIDASRARVIYYGSDPAQFSRATPAERADARAVLGKSADVPIVGFVGALGDRRKGFDTLFAAWHDLCRSGRWDADLVVVGAGAELPRWRERAAAAGLERRVSFLGFRDDVPRLLAGFDLVVHPARYEAYGLSVHEAICRGVPAIVSASAGVAEKYPPSLGSLLLENPDDPSELADRLRTWRDNAERVRAAVVPASDALLGRTWDGMAKDIVEAVVEAAA